MVSLPRGGGLHRLLNGLSGFSRAAEFLNAVARRDGVSALLLARLFRPPILPAPLDSECVDVSARAPRFLIAAVASANASPYVLLTSWSNVGGEESDLVSVAGNRGRRVTPDIHVGQALQVARYLRAIGVESNFTLLPCGAPPPLELRVMAGICKRTLVKH
jgi:hypothetical protein